MKAPPAENNALATADDAPRMLATQEVPISAILANAVERGADIAVLERLVSLHERVLASKAREAFHVAMAAFKADCPPIPRRTENSQFKVTLNGVARPRKYAALEDIAATISGPLGKNGLSFRWGDAKIEGGTMTLSCIVSHVGGHSESSSVQMPIESSAGASIQQKHGIADTYAQRYSLIRVLGLTTCDEDDDGNAAPAPKVSEEQVANLDAALVSVGVDRKRFLAWLRVETLADIPAARYAECMAKIESKRKAQA